LRAEIFARLKQEGQFNAKTGEARGLLETYRKLSQSQISAANALRLTPFSRTSIRSRDETIDLAQAFAAQPEDGETIVSDEQSTKQ
jgi:hypothetical protein